MKHMETRFLWLQKAIDSGRFAMVNIAGEKNIGDLMTKHVDEKTMLKHMAKLNL